MGMARSYLGPRPRPAASSWPSEASSSRRRRRRTRYSPSMPPTPVQSSPSYSPTSPSYSPTSPSYFRSSYSPVAGGYYYSPLPRLGNEEDEIGGDGAGLEGQDEEYHDEEDFEERGESDGDFGRRLEDSDGSGGDDGVESEHEYDDEIEEGEHRSDGGTGIDAEVEEQSGGQREQDASGGENGVEDEVQAEEEEEEGPPQPRPRNDTGNVAAVDGDVAPEPPQPPRPASPPSSSRTESSVVGEMTVTVERNELDCGICFHPLKPPIFQCDVGHVVCSPCRDKLPAEGGRCHVCRGPTGFRRCHAMEHLVESIRVACPHAVHGCASKPAYHDRERHARECPHAPCRCPAGDANAAAACSFVGPVTALVDHVATVHGWPCTAEARAGVSFGVDLRDGFNFITTTDRGGAKYLFLLNVASSQFGHAISAVWIDSCATATSSSAPAGTTRNVACQLKLSSSEFNNAARGHFETSLFLVEPMCTSNGLPNPNASFQFFVPKYGGGSGEAEAAVHVDAAISISYL